MARAGFDWLAIDLEHSVITIREAEELIRIIDLCGVTPLVRLTSNDPNLIKRVMDAGAQGVIVPLVNTEDDARKAVSSVYYPTRGTRGVGLARAQGYGTKFKEYSETLPRNAVIIVMIEHIDAVGNFEAIMSVAGIDGFIMGPYDLSASLGVPGQFDHPDVIQAICRVKELSKKVGKPGGLHVIEPDPAQLRRRIEEGFTFLAYSLDIRMLDVSCRTGLSKIR